MWRVNALPKSSLTGSGCHRFSSPAAPAAGAAHFFDVLFFFIALETEELPPILDVLFGVPTLFPIVFVVESILPGVLPGLPGVDFAIPSDAALLAAVAGRCCSRRPRPETRDGRASQKIGAEIGAERVAAAAAAAAKQQNPEEASAPHNFTERPAARNRAH